MNTKCLGLTVFLAVVLQVPSAWGSGFLLEAGVGYAALSDGEYTLSSLLDNTDPAANVVPTALENPTFTEDDTAAVSYLSLGYAWTDWFRTFVGFQQYERTASRSVADVVIASPPVSTGSIMMAYIGEVQVVSWTAEFRWAVTPRFTLSLSPEVNGVFSEETLRTSSDSAVLIFIPEISRESTEISLGVSVGAEWALTPKLSVVARYRYQDLEASWGREAQVITGGLQWAF